MAPRRILDAQPDIEVVGEAEDGRQALSLAKGGASGLLLKDVSPERLVDG